MDGLTGHIEFNSKGQRSNYALRIMQNSKDGLRQVSRTDRSQYETVGFAKVPERGFGGGPVQCHTTATNCCIGAAFMNLTGLGLGLVEAVTRITVSE